MVYTVGPALEVQPARKAATWKNSYSNLSKNVNS